jgi:hypothetical protein
MPLGNSPAAGGGVDWLFVSLDDAALARGSGYLGHAAVPLPVEARELNDGVHVSHPMFAPVVAEPDWLSALSLGVLDTRTVARWLWLPERPRGVLRYVGQIELQILPRPCIA